MISLERLQQIIPADQALANKALATSLQQIAGITNMTLPVLANAVGQLETTRDLPLISALTQAVPTSVADYYQTLSNNGAPLVVCDVLGIAAGYKVTDIFIDTVLTLANTNVAYLTSVYTTMNSTVDGTYGDPELGPVIIPSGLPGAGTYYSVTSNIGNVIVIDIPAAESAFTGTGGDIPPTGPGLIPVAQSEIGNLAMTSSAQVATLNSYFVSLGSQVALEQSLQAKAEIDFANLVANSQTTVYSLINSLPTYGQDSEQGGLFQFWEGIANVTTFTGQAVVAAMREGHNQQALDKAGIHTSNHVPSDPVPPVPAADLIPSTYTAQQAANLVIK